MDAISLDKQIHVYSFDTSAFYNDEEKELETKINQCCLDKEHLKVERDILSEYLAGQLSLEKAQTKYREVYELRREEPVDIGGQNRINEISSTLRSLGKQIKTLKSELKTMLHAHDGTRELREDCVLDNRVISVFESTLTRTLGMEPNKLYEEFMVVRTYYFDVIEDLILNGYTYKGKKYVCFTASAGQIRTKKTVFIREDVWNKHQKTLMCGLTVDSINAMGGININKYLAYLALCNSASEPWDRFDIRKSIVVDDMETIVHGAVDFIDHKTYQIERKEMDVPIVQTDGCGMVLPSCSSKNAMVRLPWVKGLLAVFPFDKFIERENRANPGINHGIVKDIYGAEHDILAEGIEVIFTKSMFKMHKYYSDWQEYVRFYCENGCTAGKCNEERDYLPNASLTYQMLQTLTDVTDKELELLSGEAVDRIRHIASDKDTMLKVFGAVSENQSKNDFQKCLLLYPELLSDPYTKDSLKKLKKKLVKEYRAGKLPVSGKYMFFIPDLYAFCEWLFLGEKNPKGLLADGEVSCGLYYKASKLDCLRSPHLYREHAVRKNVVNGMTRRWFTKNAIYTSCHDLITKITMNDFDGDTSLVCADPLLIGIAERNMRDIVPLYYEMAKAGAVQISKEEIYRGMRDAWSYGNVGVVSNDITRIWNSDNPDLDAIKILCMESNFTIDAAKTRYMPQRPDEIDARISSLVRVKTPHFFIYAKDKDAGHVEAISDSVVNRLENLVPDKRMSFTAQNIGKLRYKNMLRQKRGGNVHVKQEVVDLYDEIAKQYGFQISVYEDEENYGYIRTLTLDRFSSLGIPIEDICDMLVTHLFRDKINKRKGLFWLCFGDIVFENLKRNIPKGSIQCRKCGNRFIPKTPNQKICKECSEYKPIGVRVKACCDCGEFFEVDSRAARKVRCDSCQKEYRKQQDCERKRKKAA